MRVCKQSTARDIVVLLVGSADHITGLASATLTITASKAGAAFASITPTVTDLGSGWYKLALTTSHTDTLGDLALHITAASADPIDTLMQVVAYDMTDAAALGLTRIDAAVTSRLAPTVAARTLDVTAGGEAGIDWANVGQATTVVTLSGTTVKTATDVETDTQNIQSRIPTALVFGRIDASVGAMAADVITAAATATDFGTELVAAIDAAAHDTGRTWAGLKARIESYIAGLATGLNGSNPKYMMADGTTAAIDATQNTSTGARTAVVVTGSEP